MLKPWFLLPPQWAHDLGPFGLKVYALFAGGPTPQWHSLNWKQLHFANPLGIAGGVDKNAESLQEWWQLGAGFVEIGTVTPRPQGPNPGQIMDRDLTHEALWNKMGFPSQGAEEVFFNLRQYEERRTPVFVNIGKNRDTANADAAQDYLSVINKLKSLTDAFVVNISSPNTKGLRDLQSKEALKSLLDQVLERSHQGRSVPVLVKLSPDLQEEALSDALETSLEAGIDGFILTNTTLSRASGLSFPAEGGVSGRPLSTLSKQVLQKSLALLGSRRNGKLIVSAGGVMSPEEAFERLQMGADLVQIYSGLIFLGPGFFRQAAGRWNGRQQNVREGR